MAADVRGAYNSGGAANPNGSAQQLWQLSGTNAQAGDLAFCLFYSRASTKTLTSIVGPTACTGYPAATANGGMIWAGYKILNATDISNGYVGTATLNSVANGTSGWITLVLSGMHASTPFRSAATPTAGGASDPDPPSISTTSGDVLLALFGTMDQNDGVSAPANFTLHANAQWSTTAGTDGSSGVAYDLDGGTGSSVNPATFVTTTDAYWYAGTIALQPAAAVTWEGSFACDGISAVTVAQSSTQAVWEGSFIVDGVSSTAVTAGMTHATWEGSFACDAISSVTVVGAATQAVWEGSFTVDGLSAVAVVGYKTSITTWEGSFACDGISAVTVAQSSTQAVWEGSFTVDGVSAVVVLGAVTQAVWEGSFACDGVTAVAVAGGVTHAVWEGAFALDEVAGAVVELHAAKAQGGTLPGTNSPLTTQFFDSSGSGNHGALETFAGTTVSGYAGTGTAADPYRLVFDGTSDYVSCGDLGTVEDKTYTFEAWVLVDGAATKYLISQCGGVSDFEDFVELKLRFFDGLYYPDAAYISTGEIYRTGIGAGIAADDAYHHIACTADGTTLTAYWDGVAYGTPATLPPESAAVVNTTVGAEFKESSFFGVASIAIARIYPVALSPAEVAQNYAQGHTQFGSIAGTSAVSVIPAVTEAVWEGALTCEGLSAVAVVGGKVGGVYTYEGSFTCDGVSSVAVVVSPTQAVWEGALTCDGVSAVSVAGSTDQAVWEGALTVDGVSIVTVVGSEAGGTTIWEGSFTLDGVSAVVVVGREIAHGPDVDFVAFVGGPGWQATTVGGLAAHIDEDDQWQATARRPA